MKNFLKDFTTFAMKGNVLNLAVGIIIGAAFQNVVSSLTDNILSPIIGLFTNQNLDSLKIEFLGVTIGYGAFITSVINFVIMAFVVFTLVKTMNRITSLHSPEPIPEHVETPSEFVCPYCMTGIHENATRCPACTSHLNT